MHHFLNSKPLQALTPDEWEALCDGCGRCCLHKLQDEESGEVFYTRVACRLLDLSTGRCRYYQQRHRLVSDCVVLGPDTPAAFEWLPASCAYRLRVEGKPLPDWHPLNNAEPNSVSSAGYFVGDFAISEEVVLADDDDLQDFLISWPE